MARLIVEAVTAECRSVDLARELLMYVSVSRSDTGEPVTGLAEDNFRVASSLGVGNEFRVVRCTESRWEPQDRDPAGCYLLQLRWRWHPAVPEQANSPWERGETYAFGIQVRVPAAAAGTESRYVGQTVVAIESLGV